MTQPFDLWGQRGWARAEVVGESNYTAQIRSLFPRKLSAGGDEVRLPAQLIPEPNNRHDRNAVAVKIQGQLVGYLPREEAKRYAPVLSRLVAQGLLPQVNARVWGSEDNDEDYDQRGRSIRRSHFFGSVSLDLAEPHMLVPANLPPQKQHVLLPFGNAIQVTGEEKHMNTLAPFTCKEGEAWLYVTLHELLQQTARTSRTVVEVRIDDNPVGTLTPKMSAELLPAIQHIAAHGLLTAGRAILKGNRVKADVALYVARANELSSDWLDDLPREAAPLVQAQTAPLVDPDSHEARRDDVQQPTPEPTGALAPQAGAPAWRFNAPPGWPPPPPGWVPASGWTPDPSWPPPPPGWQFWLPAFP